MSTDPDTAKIWQHLKCSVKSDYSPKSSVRNYAYLGIYHHPVGPEHVVAVECAQFNAEGRQGSWVTTRC